MDTPLFDGKLVHSQRIIYTPSPFARASLVHLQEVGTLQARSPHASTRQGLASYLFFIVEHGSGTLEYEGQTRALRAGDCAFLDCRRPYRHYTGAPHGAAYGLLKDWRSIMASHIPARTKFENLLLTGQNLTVHGAIGVTLSAAATCSEIVGTEYLAKKIANA